MDIKVNEDKLSIWLGNDGMAYLWERERMTKPIISKFNLETTNGLDIGCGKRKSLPTAIGIDLRRGFPQKKTILKELAVPDLVCNGDDLPFKDNTIDWITAAHVIEHFQYPIKTINEWLRVLKPGGLISMIVPIAEYVGKIGDKDTDLDHKHDYSVDSFKTEVVDKLDVNLIELEYLNNEWSFICVLKKK